MRTLVSSGGAGIIANLKHPGTSFRSLLALVLLIAVAAGCFSLGMWQLGRAAERDALHDTIERGRSQAPLQLSAATRPAEFLPWRAATAQGRWLDHHTVLLENRNLGGRPGYWVATPLQLEAANNAPAVLVLRGWLPRDMQAGGALPAIPLEPGPVRIEGELHTHVPRIFELWQWAGGVSSQLPDTLPAADGTPPVVQNLVLADYAQASGLKLLPTVLAQTGATVAMSETDAETFTDSAQQPSNGARQKADVPTATAARPSLQREWPGPSLDSDQNRGYALQWFSFCAIAAIAALFITRGLLRRHPSQHAARKHHDRQ